jgi:non-specific serine/threonine protein kinase
VTNESGGALRYRMTETIRQYAREKLADTDEGASLRDRHLAYYATLAEDAVPEFRSGSMATHARLLLEIDNVRTALGWAQETGRDEDGLRLAAAYYRVWFVYASHAEGLAWLQGFAEQGAPVTSLPWLRAYLELYEAHAHMGDYSAAYAAAERALPMAEALNSSVELSTAYYAYGYVLRGRGELAAARAYFERALAVADALSAKRDIAWLITSVYDGMKEAWLDEGDFARAEVYYNLARAQQTVNPLGKAGPERRWGYVLLERGDAAGAYKSIRDSLLDNWTAGDRKGVAASLAASGVLASASGDLTRAARLFGASEAVCEFLRTPLTADDISRIQRSVTALREQLDAAVLNAAWVEGRAMTLEQAIDYALDNIQPISTGPRDKIIGEGG